jgi:hypothetical protein
VAFEAEHHRRVERLRVVPTPSRPGASLAAVACEGEIAGSRVHHDRHQRRSGAVLGSAVSTSSLTGVSSRERHGHRSALGIGEHLEHVLGLLADRPYTHRVDHPGQTGT